MYCLKKQLIPLAVLVALVTALWGPTLWNGKSLIQGDSIIHSLSLWAYHVRSLTDFGSVLWSNEMYGGHPLFAESQGEFANPLNMLLARMGPPVYVNNFAHWIAMIMAGVAVYGLSRTIGNSNWSSGFAALATVFSSAWLTAQHNMTYGNAVAWIPWFLWAAELWIKRPGPATALGLGAAAAISIFAGYPHLFHGTVLYIVATLLPGLFTTRDRAEMVANWRSIITTSLAAAMICAGIAAVQWLPLLELAGQSHRSTGTALLYSLTFLFFSHGLLYNLTADGLPFQDFTPLIGSLLVCIAASLIVLFRTTPRAKGHVLAAFFLFNLGIGTASPIFRFLYDYHLIPGMHYFRIMTPYLNIAIVGISIVAATAIDGLAAALNGTKQSEARAIVSLKNILAGLALIAFWVFFIRYQDIEFARVYKHFIVAGMAILGVAFFAALKKPNWIPALMFALLAAECAAIKLHPFHFGDVAILQEPASAKLLKEDPLLKDYKTFDASGAGAYTMQGPQSPDLESNARRAVVNLSGMGSQWEISSLEGALALPLYRRSFIESTITDEMHKKSATPPGLRLIDILSVKYIFFGTPDYAPAFRLYYRDAETNTSLIENTAAKPRFQIYGDYALASSPQEALGILQKATSPLLVLEQPTFSDRDFSLPATPVTTNPDIQFTVLKDRSTRYKLLVDAKQAGWLFLADANYPGWRAYIDGKETAVFIGQLLGKAIFIPAGSHTVKIEFRPKSFELGLVITLSTLAIIAFFLMFSLVVHVRNRMQRP